MYVCNNREESIRYSNHVHTYVHKFLLVTKYCATYVRALLEMFPFQFIVISAYEPLLYCSHANTYHCMCIYTLE